MIFVILVLGFIIRVGLFSYWTHSSDMGLWIYWAGEIGKLGFDGFFDKVTWTDYLPFYFYVLWFIQKLSGIFSNIPVEFLHKLPASLSDIGTSFFIYKILENKSRRAAFVGAAIYAFNPAIIFNSALWGQVDGVGAFFVVSSFYFLLKRKFFASGAFLGLGLVFKPLFLFALPIFLLVAFLQKKKNLLPLGKFLAGASLSAWIVLLPFVLSSSLVSPLGPILEPVQLFLERYQSSVNQYPYTSVNAFNFWAIGGRWWKSDLETFVGVSLQTWGAMLVLFSLSISLFFVAKLWGKFDKTSTFAASLFVIFLALFAFATRAHERHMFTALPFLLILAAENQLLLALYFLLSISYFANLYFALQWLLASGKFVFGWPIINTFSLFISAAAVIAVLALGFLIVKQKTKYMTFIFPLGFLLLISARLVNLDYPPKFYFDEVYHAFTAQEIVKGNPAAWEFWADPPEGVAYEWTHPPLAKLIMAGGIFLFGEPIGWRLPGAFFGLFVVYLVYLLAKEILKEEKIALLSAFLFSLEGLALVVSRIGMAEIYFLTFALLMLLLFLKQKYIWSAIFFGLALATKWIAAFLLPLLFVAWFVYEKKWKKAYLGYFLAPILYFASYLPFFLTGHNLAQWLATQKQMWGYHTGLVATHPYSSPWWSWPLALQPVWYFTEKVNGLVSNIYASGNPVIFWGGLAAVLFGLVYRFKKRDRAVTFLLAGYFLMFLPWAASPRIMFLHHYLPAIPFMVIILAWLLVFLWQRGKRIVVIGFLSLAVLGFILYYPLWIGLPVPPWWSAFLIP